VEIGIFKSGARERPAQGGWAGVGQRAKAEKESRGREREKRKRAEQMPHACFGRKMVTENFSVNLFPKFP
jgi:hypothetical protein